MSLRMPAPWRNPSTGIFYLRVRLPADLSGMKGTRISLPVAEGWRNLVVGDAVKVSLGTREPAEAKSRHHAAMAQLEKLFAAVRHGPVALTHRDVVSLAGEAHLAVVKAMEDNPLLSAAMWRDFGDQVSAAREGRDGLHRDLMIPLRQPGQETVMTSDLSPAVLEVLERRVGPFVDQALREHAATVDASTRGRLLDWTAKEIAKAMDRVAGMAEGDYSPDPDAGRRPVFSAPSIAALAPPPPKITEAQGERNKFALLTVVDDYFAEIQEGGRRQDRGRGAIKRWKPIFSGIIKFTGKDDIRRFSPADIVDWKDHRIASGISASTFVRADIAALKAIFGWAVSNGRIESNPVRLKVSQSAAPRSRDKGFTDTEATALLQSALARKPGGRELPETAAALRWLPWLMAFTGSRPAEMAQLRKQDVCLTSDPPTIRITPEAGAVKTNELRTVPIHEQLIDLGFGKFVESQGDGPLFRKPATPPGRIAAKVGEAARTVVPDEAVQPNYGWRHRFKTIARENGFDPRIVDAIQGHSARTAGETYGDVTPKAMMTGVISKLPRYEV